MNQQPGQKTIVLGKRVAIEKTCEEAHETKEDQQSAHQRQKDKMQVVNAIDQACVLSDMTLHTGNAFCCVLGKPWYTAAAQHTGVQYSIDNDTVIQTHDS